MRAYSERRRSPRGSRLPILAVRCPPEIREALKRQAEAEETTPSAIVRAALAKHLGAPAFPLAGGM